jgi:quinoprotein glucose dehydrogenase
MPGEQSWPTQPFPTKPEPFAKQTFTEADINPYGNITDQAREAFRERLSKTVNFGMWTPISHEDTLHIPGSNGGALFGGTAAGPDGSVYVITQDNPAILRLLREGESAGRGGGAGAGAAALPGAAIYATHCQVCHGPNRVGTAEGAALLDLAGRLDADAITALLVNGKGRMPAFPQINSADAALLTTYLLAPPPGRGGGGGGRGRGAGPAGPPPPPELVVGSGSAVPRARGGAGFGGGGAGPRAYPEGVPQTSQFVINAYGTFTTMGKPPYTTIVKYDLNNDPVIKWRVGLGDDPRLAALGIHDTGTPQMRNSLVVTSTGLLFAVGADNKVRAYDTDTGRVLWTANVPGTFRGGPAMYTVDGRQYLLLPAAATRYTPGGNQAGGAAPPPPPAQPDGPLGYLAFALPEAR